MSDPGLSLRASGQNWAGARKARSSRAADAGASTFGTVKSSLPGRAKIGLRAKLRTVTAIARVGPIAEISGQTGRIQGAPRDAVAAAAEERGAAIREIGRGAASAATGAQSVTENVGAARGLARRSDELDHAGKAFPAKPQAA